MKYNIDNIEIIDNFAVISIHVTDADIYTRVTWNEDKEEKTNISPDDLSIEDLFPTLPTNTVETTMEITNIDYDFNTMKNIVYTPSDDGIGTYEFWGERCNDSHPYIKVSADMKITVSADVFITIEIKEKREEKTWEEKF